MQGCQSVVLGGAKDPMKATLTVNFAYTFNCERLCAPHLEPQPYLLQETEHRAFWCEAPYRGRHDQTSSAASEH